MNHDFNPNVFVSPDGKFGELSSKFISMISSDNFNYSKNKFSSELSLIENNPDLVFKLNYGSYKYYYLSGSEILGLLKENKSIFYLYYSKTTPFNEVLLACCYALFENNIHYASAITGALKILNKKHNLVSDDELNEFCEWVGYNTYLTKMLEQQQPHYVKNKESVDLIITFVINLLKEFSTFGKFDKYLRDNGIDNS